MVEQGIQFFLEQGSYGLMFAWIIAAGLGLPLPEDVAMISGAILAQRGITNLTVTVVVLTISVLLGDTILYTIARRLGPAIYERKFIQRVMPPDRRVYVEGLIDKYGSLVVFGARHVAGLRGAIFAMCAIHGISYPRFIIADALALAISLPVFMGIGWLFSDSIDRVAEHAASFEQYVMLAIGGIVLLVGVIHLARTALKRWRERSAPSEVARKPVEP
ncbi:MAG: DedA family protein [Sandaracinaceae bacterium]|nr:DedA family protein [Sandaracinaceae bacterium]